MNLDQVRVGRALEIQARRFSESQVKNLEVDQALIQEPRIFEEQHNALVKNHNAENIKLIPAAGLMVTDDNREDLVVRYTLKPEVSVDQAQAAIEKREALLHSVDWSGNQVALDEILSQAFDIHEVTMAQALENRALMRFPSECLHRQPEPVTHSSNAFDAVPPIPGADLTLRLEELDMTPGDLAKKLDGVHHKTIGAWMRDGVPPEHILPVRLALQ